MFYDNQSNIKDLVQHNWLMNLKTYEKNCKQFMKSEIIKKNFEYLIL